MGDVRCSSAPKGVSGTRAASVTEIARFLVRALKARFRDHGTELALIQRHIRPGDTVCDVGANKGSFVYWLSRWCRAGRVVAFEPQRLLADRLASICATIGLDNVSVEACAVHSTSGRQCLYVPDRHKPGASLNRSVLRNEKGSVELVPVVALDDFFGNGERVSVLKVDVEGAELGVFEGARRILERSAPLLIFECENRHLGGITVREVFAYLQSLGYTGSFVAQGRLLPVSSFWEPVHQCQDGEWFWKSKNYCNNFIFRKGH